MLRVILIVPLGNLSHSKYILTRGDRISAFLNIASFLRHTHRHGFRHNNRISCIRVHFWAHYKCFLYTTRFFDEVAHSCHSKQLTKLDTLSDYFYRWNTFLCKQSRDVHTVCNIRIVSNGMLHIGNDLQNLAWKKWCLVLYSEFVSEVFSFELLFMG